MVGAGLFHVSQAVQQKEDRVSHLQTQIMHEKNQLHLLRAEWHYLNQPQRLQALAEKYLNLRPTDGTQVARLALPSTKKIYANTDRLPKHKPVIKNRSAELGMQMALMNAGSTTNGIAGGN
jgi:hypothetical protein